MLTDATGQKSGISATIAIPDKLLQLLTAKVSEVRVFPEVASKAMEITKNPDCSIADFVAVVERDVMLASEILRVANSVIYAHGKTISNLHRAIPRIGFRQCRNLIVTASTLSLMQSIPVSEARSRDALTRHCMLTSTVAASLNRMLSLGFCGEEFAAGLLHDLGRVLLAWVAPEAGIQWDFFGFDEDETILEREANALGTTHCLVGGWVSEKYGLPKEFREVMVHHHHPTQADHSNKLVALISLADQMANHLQETGSADGYVQVANEATDVLIETGVPKIIDEINSLSSVILWESSSEAHDLAGVSTEG